MTDSASDCIALARAELQQARKILSDEIKNYPTPISGCDAAFNHMLAEREQVFRALGALTEAIFVPTPRTPDLHSGVESR